MPGDPSEPKAKQPGKGKGKKKGGQSDAERAASDKRGSKRGSKRAAGAAEGAAMGAAGAPWGAPAAAGAVSDLEAKAIQALAAAEEAHRLPVFLTAKEEDAQRMAAEREAARVRAVEEAASVAAAEEAVRMAAEKEAARLAAEAAARQAAEEEAAQVAEEAARAAAEEAERVAAAQERMRAAAAEEAARCRRTAVPSNATLRDWALSRDASGSPKPPFARGASSAALALEGAAARAREKGAGAIVRSEIIRGPFTLKRQQEGRETRALEAEQERQIAERRNDLVEEKHARAAILRAALQAKAAELAAVQRSASLEACRQAREEAEATRRALAEDRERQRQVGARRVAQQGRTKKWLSSARHRAVLEQNAAHGSAERHGPHVEREEQVVRRRQNSLDGKRTRATRVFKTCSPKAIRPSLAQRDEERRANAGAIRARSNQLAAAADAKRDERLRRAQLSRTAVDNVASTECVRQHKAKEQERKSDIGADGRQTANERNSHAQLLRYEAWCRRRELHDAILEERESERRRALREAGFG